MVGTPLEEPLTVRVDDTSGQPLEGETVSWSVGKGSGSLNKTSTQTDSRGQAQVGWNLGSTAGVHEVVAEVGNLQPVRFFARAEPGPPSRVQNISGDHQNSLVGTLLPEPLVIKVVTNSGMQCPRWRSSGQQTAEA